MAVLKPNSGNQTAVIGTEHTLATITTAGVYLMKVDLINLIAGDTVELRIKDMVDGTNYRQAYYDIFTGVQTDLAAISVPIPIFNGVQFTLKQTAGTGRVFPWAILSL